MSTRRLGNTVFSDVDPLDDLRPSKGKKLLSLPEEARAEPEKVIAIELPTASAPAPETLTPEATALGGPGAPEEPLTTGVTGAPSSKAKRQTPEDGEGKGLRKIRFSANISVSTKERADNAAYWVPGLNLSTLTEVALEKEIRKLEKEFNGGEPFKAAGSLKYGRPRG